MNLKYYMRLKVIGHKNNKSYNIVITKKKYVYAYKFIEKIGIINHLEANSKRKDRIILLNIPRLRYWLSRKVKIMKSSLFPLLFFKIKLGQGNKSIKNELFK